MTATPVGPAPAPAAYPDHHRPRPLEIVSGMTFGLDEQVIGLRPRGAGAPRPAIEAIVRQALAHPPCLVSFSGGRDSSAVLAVAADVARRDGLPLPVPATLRFAGAPNSNESGWQEFVIHHLGLPDWERIEFTSELDIVGPVARAVLRRHGALWPPLTHSQVPIFQRAAGGTVLTGVGGDEALTGGTFGGFRGPGRWRAANVRTVALACAPRPLRRVRFARRKQVRFPWLLPPVEADVMARHLDWRARTPDRWDARLLRLWRSRYRALQSSTLDLLATDAGARVVNVFMEPSVVRALARRFGMRGPLDRTAAMAELFGHLLPDEVVTRRSKAFFDEAYLNDYTREFAASWTGAGVDLTLVDPDQLASEWRSARPSPQSALLLQHTWLAADV